MVCGSFVFFLFLYGVLSAILVEGAGEGHEGALTTRVEKPEVVEQFIFALFLCCIRCVRWDKASQLQECLYWGVGGAGQGEA